ncbi:MAG: VanW family protein [bacterium]|nr:VanW family protein [bacterium]
MARSNWPIHPWFLVPQVLLLGIILLLAFHIAFLDRVYLGVKVAGINVGGLKKESVSEKLNTQVLPEKLILKYQDKEFVLEGVAIDLAYDLEATSQNTFGFGRKKRLIPSMKHKLEAIRGKVNLPLIFTSEEDKLNEILQGFAEEISSPPVEPQVFVEKGTVVIDPGKRGTVVDTQELKKRVLETLSLGSQVPITFPVNEVNPELSEADAGSLKAKAETLLSKQLKLTFEYQTFVYKDADLVTLLKPTSVDEKKIEALVGEIAAVVDRPAENARFVFEDGKVKEFTPAKKGTVVQKDQAISQFTASLNSLLSSEDKIASLNLPVVQRDPEVTNDEVNNLGIKELIGRGTSVFHGSIPGRIYNVALAASRINGLLIKPGETFSFNAGLGDVSAYTGYQQAYVIKQGRTVLGDGGGVCQVSTTLFRAALNTGLPIEERKAHAYRVHYYEEDIKPGIDATVYSPSADFKFKNDTPATILIQTKTDTKNMTLVIELYGTSDGRVAEILNHKIWGVTPAPLSAFQDDPTLPLGKKKQVDWSAPGTKASFDYKVTRAGQTLQERTFYSNYRPWQAVFLVGTGPAE